MRLLPCVVMLFVAPLLAGCVVEDPDGALPRLRLELVDQTIRADETLEVRVRFVNTLDTTVNVQTPEGCIEVDVWTVVRGETLFLTDPAEEGCTGSPATAAIEPGATREWGPYRLRPSEYKDAEGALFTPGTYRLAADVAAGSTSWSWHNETTYEVEEAKGTLEIEIVPERETFEAGETIRITARLTNTRDEPYTYRSRDGCNDIHVWVEVGEGERGRVRLYPNMEPYFCSQALTDFEVAPGESLETDVHWDGSEDGRGGGPFVAGGVYTLFAALDGDEELPTGYGQVGVRRSD